MQSWHSTRHHHDWWNKCADQAGETWEQHVDKFAVHLTLMCHWYVRALQLRGWVRIWMKNKTRVSLLRPFMPNTACWRVVFAMHHHGFILSLIPLIPLCQDSWRRIVGFKLLYLNNIITVFHASFKMSVVVAYAPRDVETIPLNLGALIRFYDGRMLISSICTVN